MYVCIFSPYRVFVVRRIRGKMPFLSAALTANSPFQPDGLSSLNEASHTHAASYHHRVPTQNPLPYFSLLFTPSKTQHAPPKIPYMHPRTLNHQNARPAVTLATPHALLLKDSPQNAVPPIQQSPTDHQPHRDRSADPTALKTPSDQLHGVRTKGGRVG